MLTAGTRARVLCTQLFDLETSYLNDSAACGTVLHGFETFLTANKTASSAKKPKAFKPEERLFSLSSVTSPASRDGAH